MWWSAQQTAKIDADGSLAPTTGECKQGMDIAYNGVWGYHPLLVSLANTQEPLYLLNRSGNRHSHEGVIPLYDKAIALCRQGGFQDIPLSILFQCHSPFDYEPCLARLSILRRNQAQRSYSNPTAARQ